MKQCPVCNATVFEDMDRCYGCLYQFGSGSETTESQKAGELEGPEGPERREDAAEPEDVAGFGSTEMPGERLGIRDVKAPDRTAEHKDTKALNEPAGFEDVKTLRETAEPKEVEVPSEAAGFDTTGKPNTAARPQEPQDLHETESTHTTRMPVLEIRRDPHEQTALTVRLELHLDFDSAQTTLREEQHALAPH